MKKSFKLFAMTALVLAGSLASAPKANALFWIKSYTGTCYMGSYSVYTKNFITGSVTETVYAC